MPESPGPIAPFAWAVSRGCDPSYWIPLDIAASTAGLSPAALRALLGFVEVIVSTLNDFQALALLKELQKVGHTKVQLLGGDTIKTTDMLKGAGLIEGLYATSPVLEAKEFTTGKPFLEKYIDAYQKPPGIWRPLQLRQHLCVDGRHAKGQVG